MPLEREDAVKQLYKSKNPESFWADFGDFKPFYMEEVVAVHFNGGFGRAGKKVRLTQPPVCTVPHLATWPHPPPLPSTPPAPKPLQYLTWCHSGGPDTQVTW